MRILRLVWEFRGADAKKIAEHHLIHLNEYLERNSLKVDSNGVTEHSPMYASAFLVCNETLALELREPLKPQAAYLEAE
jgi:hypothetical protein